jgi:hypothetical protein
MDGSGESNQTHALHRFFTSRPLMEANQGPFPEIF